MSNVTKHDQSRFIPATANVATEEMKKLNTGNVVSFGKDDSELYLRIMNPFKLQDGRGYWFSMSDIHFKVPVPNPPSGNGSAENPTVTHFCPRAAGQRCLTCEHEDQFKMMGVWGGKNSLGCGRVRKVRFNAILHDTPERGVVIFQDGLSTLRAVNALLEQEPKLLDPFEGGFVHIKKEDGPPWRRVHVPRAGWVSLDAIDGVDIEWAFPENLPDLDASWEYPTLEEQLQWYSKPGRSVEATSRTVSTRPAALPKSASKGAEVEEDLLADLNLLDSDDDE